MWFSFDTLITLMRRNWESSIVVTAVGYDNVMRDVWKSSLALLEAHSQHISAALTQEFSLPVQRSWWERLTASPRTRVMIFSIHVEQGNIWHTKITYEVTVRRVLQTSVQSRGELPSTKQMTPCKDQCTPFRSAETVWGATFTLSDMSSTKRSQIITIVCSQVNSGVKAPSSLPLQIPSSTFLSLLLWYTHFSGEIHFNLPFLSLPPYMFWQVRGDAISDSFFEHIKLMKSKVIKGVSWMPTASSAC